MKKTVLFVSILAMTLVGASSSLAAKPDSSETCATIQSGTIVDVNGNTISKGYDEWGYNYQAHMFNGLYENYSRPAEPATEGDVTLMMKWSDNWLSNKDCNGDGKLDRGGAEGADDNISKGWLTNHEQGSYLGDDGEMHHYTYFVKIVFDGGAACAAESETCIWGAYNIIQEVWNDPYGGMHGVNHDSLVNPGLGLNDHWTIDL